jgi:purine-nucleoside phosphorylase
LSLFNSAKQLSAKLKDMQIKPPAMQVVLGSSFSDVFSHNSFSDNWVEKAQLSFAEVGLNTSTAPGHRGLYHYLENKHTGVSLVCQVGRLHGYEGNTPQNVVAPLLVHRLLGTKKFILTNAAGALKPEFEVGSVMLIKDHVNLTGQNPLVGVNPVGAGGEPLGPRFPDMSQAYDQELSQKLREQFLTSGLKVNEGTYLGLLGPSFETPAEIKLFSQWGLHAVGMSTVWETIALRHTGARVAGISLISNLGCGLSDQPLDHFAILKLCKEPSEKMLQSILRFAQTEGVENE